MKLERVLCCGAGTLGGSLARTLAGYSIDVTILEKDASSLERALRDINARLDHEIDRWSLTQSEKKAILSRIHGEHQLRRFDHIDAVFEAVPEHLETKQTVLCNLEAHCPDSVVIFSNCAALSITELAALLRRPDRLIGMHFLPPVQTVPVVEVVRGLATSDQTFEYAKYVLTTIGKTPVEVFEYPGYITTRCIIPMLNEAMHVVMEGVASAKDVDTAMKLGFGFQQGPLTLIDQIGLDTIMYWMESLFQELGDPKYRPCPLLRKMVRAGHLGAKVGRGFFTYPDHIQQSRES